MWLPNLFRFHRSIRGSPPLATSRHDLPRSWEDIGHEVEAFLAGRLVEHLRERGRAGRPWAALNRVAHASLVDLARILEDADGRTAAPWLPTERALVFRVLAGTVDVASVRELQQAVLIPLELKLIEESKTQHTTVREVFDAAFEAVDRHLLDH